MLRWCSHLGVSQSIQDKECPDCDKVDNSDGPNKTKWLINRGVKGYKLCGGSVVRFQLQRGSYCARNHLLTVEIVKQCLNKGNCQDLMSSDSKQESSKATTKNPSTTMPNSPTTPSYVTSQKTTQRKPDIIESTEATEGETTREATQEITTPSKGVAHRDLENNLVVLQHGDGPLQPSEPPDEEDIDGKMKDMRTAIISLIVIILAMVCAGTGVYCRKKKFKSKPSFSDYAPAPSEETIEMEKTQ